MNKFQEYNINISQEEKNIINNYLSGIKAFVREKSLEDELYKDIENRLFEKLSEKENLNKIEIKKIIIELGEVEDIFTDEIEKTNENFQTYQKYNFKEKLLSIGIFLLWFICILIVIGGIDGKNNIIKIIIVFMMILGARWTIQYKNILGTLKKDCKNFSKLLIQPKSLLGIIIIAIIILTFGGIITPNLTVFFLLLFLCFYIIGMLLGDGNNFVKTSLYILGNIFRILFFTGFGILFIFGILGLLAVAGAYFTDFNYEGMRIFIHFPIYFVIGILFGAFAFFIFALNFISYGLKKKGFGKTFLLFGVLSLFIAFFCAFYTGFDLWKKYSHSEKIEKTYEFNIKKGSKIYNLYFSNLMDTDYKINYNFKYFKYINLKKSKDGKLRITTKFDINIPETDIKTFTENLNPLLLHHEKNNLFFNFKEGNLFGNKAMPLFFALSYLEVEIPENIVFTSTPNFFLSQINIPEKYEKYEPYLSINNCKEYFYEAKRDVFSCNIDENRLMKVQQDMKILELYKNLSTLSPIKHIEQFKRNYHFELCYKNNENYCASNDWMLDYESVKLNSGTVNFIYQDKSLKIKAQAEYKENNDLSLNFLNFKILEISKNEEVFNQKYYTKESLEYIFEGK